MRAIDGDALKEEIDYYIREAGWGETRNEALRWCLEFIDNQTTIELRCEECEAFNKTRLLIPQPERKKGEWIPQDHNKHHGMISTAVYYFPKCSVCGESANYTNFCPNCGADLREDQNDQSK